VPTPPEEVAVSIDSFRIRQISPMIGAKIDGVDLTTADAATGRAS
jgi:hypothetical protein